MALRIETDAVRYLAIVGVDGTDYREIYQTAAKMTGVAWTRDGTGVLFAEKGLEVPGTPWRVMRVPAMGGHPDPTGLEVDSPIRVLLSLNADGTRLATSSQKSIGEIWALDNVSTGLK